jgi:serine/threonine protein kinase
MVHPVIGAAVIELVLYSAATKTWKVGDFGLTAEGTSRRAFTTTAARGTQCYRAPELLKEHPKFNNKVDIFAAGCVLFELATGGQRAFASDFLVHEYAAFSRPLQIPLGDIDSWSRPKLSHLIPAMLNVNSDERPSAHYLRSEFSINRAITIGEAWKGRQDHMKAIEAYSEAAQQSPGSFVFENLGHLYAGIGDYPSAISSYNAALGHGALILVDLADALRRDGQYDKAIERYQEAISKDPKNARLWGLRGETFLDKSEYDDAIIMFQKAAKLAPFDSVFQAKLGEIYFTTGKIDASIKAYESAIKRNRSLALERALAEAKAAKVKVDVSAFSGDKKSVRRLFRRLNISGLLGNQNPILGAPIRSQGISAALADVNAVTEIEPVHIETYTKSPTRYRRDNMNPETYIPKPIEIVSTGNDDSVTKLKYPDYIENQPSVSNYDDRETDLIDLNRTIGLTDFNFLSNLGRGNFAKIMLAETKISRQLYAIKVFKKEFLCQFDKIEDVWQEKRVFLLANKDSHPFLPKLHSCFQTETRVYFVMEYIPGGDLLFRIQQVEFTLPQAR